MALQRMPGCNNQWLFSVPVNIPPAFASVLLDAAADRITMIGRFAHQGGATKTVDGVEFLFGTNVKTNGSTMQVSLQNPDLANGPIIREDGTPDQTLTIANADAGFVSDAWYGGDFDAAGSRSVAIGELVCVVFQFGTFVAGDSVNLRMVTIPTSALLDSQSCVSTNLTGTVATQTMLSNVVLRCSDGTFGTLQNAWPCKAINTHAFNVGTGTADEYANGVQFPFPCRTTAMWAEAIYGGATFATEHLLYSDTTALKTVTVDHNAVSSNASARRMDTTYPEEAHVANTLYRVAIRPTGTTNITIYSTDVNEAGHLACLPGGTACHLWTRLDQGAWGGEVTTRRLLTGIRLSAFDDGVSAGGGGVIAHSLIAGGG